MEVRISENESKGRAYIGEATKPDAEMTFSKAGDDKIIIDHTEVKELLKGQGAGKQMLMALVQMARGRNIKILPLCPFAHAMFRKDPSIKDVWS